MDYSIVLISFNQEKFIKEALDGIRNQTLMPKEVIIADDGSIDNTPSIIEEYVALYSLENDWKLLLSKENRGININLQEAIEETTSEVIIIMAGDDIAMPNKAEVSIKLFRENPLMHIVATSLDKIDDNGNVIGELIYSDKIENDIIKVIKNGMPHVFPVGQAWKRSLFQRFGKLPYDLPNEDDQLTFRGVLDGGIFCSAIKTTKYRIHSNSASSWIRNNQSGNVYFNRFKADMPVRRRNMEYWYKTVEDSDVENKELLLKLISFKIEIYKSFNNLDCISFLEG